MPIKRLKKARASLPSGYQYGDAGKPAIRIRFLREYYIHAPESAKQLRAFHGATDNETPALDFRGPR